MQKTISQMRKRRMINENKIHATQSSVKAITHNTNAQVHNFVLLTVTVSDKKGIT